MHTCDSHVTAAAAAIETSLWLVPTVATPKPKLAIGINAVRCDMRVDARGRRHAVADAHKLQRLPV